MRQHMYDMALHLTSMQHRLNATMHEYNTVHGFKPARGNMDKLVRSGTKKETSAVP